MPTLDLRENDIASVLPEIVKKAKALNANNQTVEVLKILSKEPKSLEEIIASLKAISLRKWDFQMRLERAATWVLYVKKQLKPPFGI